METTELLTKTAIAPLKFIPRSLQCIGLGSFLAFELERGPLHQGEAQGDRR